MDFNEYQDTAKTTAIYPYQGAILYPALGLANEAGEVAGKAKKWMRDETENWLFTIRRSEEFPAVISDERREAMLDELGDVLWYLANTVTDLEATLDEVAQRNVNKLLGRKERGTLQGDGDVR